MILTLASVVNYDRKWCYNLERHLLTTFFICKTDLSKPVKQEVNSTVILPPLVFRVVTFYSYTHLWHT